MVSGDVGVIEVTIVPATNDCFSLLGVADSVVGTYDEIFSLGLLFTALEGKLLDDTVF